MKHYVSVDTNDVITSVHMHPENVKINLSNETEYEALEGVEYLENYKAVFNADKTKVIGYGEYVEPAIPEPIIPEPTTEERLEALEMVLLELL